MEPVESDAFDREALVRAASGSQVIFNALNPLYTEWNEQVLPMAENVIAAAEAAGALHMLPGNVYNFDREIGLDMREDSPQRPRPKRRGEGVRTVVFSAGEPQRCLPDEKRPAAIERGRASACFVSPGR